MQLLHVDRGGPRKRTRRPLSGTTDADDVNAGPVVRKPGVQPGIQDLVPDLVAAPPQAVQLVENVGEYVAVLRQEAADVLQDEGLFLPGECRALCSQGRPIQEKFSLS